MIQSIELENYRGFEHYKLSNLARVNLLVGKNNSGKSSILEAVHLLATGADPRVLSRITRHRGEFITYGEEWDTSGEVYPDISHFYHGHTFGVGSHFTLKSSNSIQSRSNKFNAVLRYSIENFPKRMTDEDRRILANYEEMFDNYDMLTPFIFRIEGTNLLGHRLSLTSAVSEDGGFPSGTSGRRMIHFKGINTESLTVLFITPNSLQRSLMSKLWNKAVHESRERDVVKAMQILTPTLNNVFFLSEEHLSYDDETTGGILVGFDGARKRIPLGSYGEGMRRLFALALSLANAQNGILMIDEVDTGLHYSIMGDMWKLIVETARANDTQVFLTTHSLDCVRGLAWLCENHPELGKEVSLQKIEPNLKESVSLNADEIRIAIDQDLEVR